MRRIAGQVFEKDASGDDEHGQKDDHVRIGLNGLVRKETRDDLEGQPRAGKQEPEPQKRTLSGLQSIKSPNSLEGLKAVGVIRREALLRRGVLGCPDRECPRPPGRTERKAL